MKPLVIGAIVFAVGAVGGNATAGGGEIETVTVTKYVPAPAPEPEPAVVYRFPDACQDVLDAARQIYYSAAKIDTASSKQLDIISNIRVSPVDHDMLLQAENEQRDLQGRTANAIVNLAAAKSAYDTAIEDCR